MRTQPERWKVMKHRTVRRGDQDQTTWHLIPAGNLSGPGGSPFGTGRLGQVVVRIVRLVEDAMKIGTVRGLGIKPSARAGVADRFLGSKLSN